MKSIRTYLIVTGALFVFALAALIVVWYLYQNLAGVQPSTFPTSEEEAVVSPRVSTGTVDVSEDVTVTTIHTSSLGEEQRKVFATFGLENATITITDAQITCAKDAIGEIQFDEIVSGRAPSPLEALQLLPCFKK